MRSSISGGRSSSGKSIAGLEVGEDAGQTIAPSTINLTQLAAELPHCLATLCLGLGRGEIGDRLGLQQIELAVEEGAAGEFAGLGEA